MNVRKHIRWIEGAHPSILQALKGYGGIAGVGMALVLLLGLITACTKEVVKEIPVERVVEKEAVKEVKVVVTPTPIPTPVIAGDPRVAKVREAIGIADEELEEKGAEQIVGNYRIGVIVEEAEPFTVVEGGVLVRRRPTTETHHLEVVLRDVTTKRFLPNAGVTITVLDQDGEVVAQKQALQMWAEFQHYAENFALAPGSYTLRVDVKPPRLGRHEDFAAIAASFAQAEFPLTIEADGASVEGPEVTPLTGSFKPGDDVLTALEEALELVEVGDYRVGFVVEEPEPLWFWEGDKLVEQPIPAGFNHHLEIVLLERETNRIVPNAPLKVTLTNVETGDMFTFRPGLLLTEFFHYGWNAPVPPGNYKVTVEIGIPTFARHPKGLFERVEVARFTQTVALGGEATKEPFTITLVDDLHREVKVPYPPQRIAATVSFPVELLMTLGYEPVLRPNIPEQYVFPPRAKEIPTVEVSHRAGPNLEQIAAAQPDLVITAPAFAQFIPAIEETLGVPVLVYDISSFADVVEKVRTFGLLVGRQAEAEEEVADLQARLKALQQGLPKEGPKVFALFGTRESFLGFLPDSYLGNLVELLGGQLITRGDEPHERFRGFTPFSLETVVARDPDIILIVRHGRPSPEREENFAKLQEDPAWQSIKAVREGRVYELSEWLYLRYPGPRVIQALEELRAILWPERSETVRPRALGKG